MPEVETEHMPAQRYCPQCRLATSEVMCPQDGTTTFVMVTVDTERVTNLAAGTVIAGRYRTVKRIGKGGFGAVYEAQHTASGQLLALKLLALESEENAEEVYFRFFQEARATAGLRHPNTVRLYDFGQTEDGVLFMAMELLQGPTLQGYTRAIAKQNQVLTEAETLTIGIEVLKALQEAHAAGLVHRDLKPENIMLADIGEDSPVVKVLDFGIARQIDNGMTVGGRLLGTPKYMSPEQCCGAEDLDARSDLYSLGVILYQCVTGKTPFAGEMLALLSAHISMPVPALSDHTRTPLSQAFVDVIDKALAKEPADRWPDSREMRRALEEVAGAGGKLRRLEVLPAAGSSAPLILTPSAMQEPSLAKTSLARVTASKAGGPTPAPTAMRDASDAQTVALANVSAKPAPVAGTLHPASVDAPERAGLPPESPSRSGLWAGAAVALVVLAAVAWAVARPDAIAVEAKTETQEMPAPASAQAPAAQVRPAVPTAPAEVPARAVGAPAPLAPPPAAAAPVEAAPTPTAAPAELAAEPAAPAPAPVTAKPKTRAKPARPSGTVENHGAAPIKYLD